MALPEVVVHVEARHDAGDASGGLFHPHEFGDDRAEGPGAVILPAERDGGHSVAQNARGDGMTLGVVGIEQVVRRGAFHHLGKLPAEVDGILDTDIQALAAGGVVHMRGVAGEEDAAFAVGLGLPAHIGEP